MCDNSKPSSFPSPCAAEESPVSAMASASKIRRLEKQALSLSEELRAITKFAEHFEGKYEEARKKLLALRARMDAPKVPQADKPVRDPNTPLASIVDAGQVGYAQSGGAPAVDYTIRCQQEVIDGLRVTEKHLREELDKTAHQLKQANADSKKLQKEWQYLVSKNTVLRRALHDTSELALRHAQS